MSCPSHRSIVGKDNTKLMSDAVSNCSLSATSSYLQIVDEVVLEIFFGDFVDCNRFGRIITHRWSIVLVYETGIPDQAIIIA